MSMCVCVCVCVCEREREYVSERGEGGSDLVVEPLGAVEALERQAQPPNFA